MANLITYVHVYNAEGESETFGPDDKDPLPQWAAEQMGAHCFEDGKHPYPDGDYPDKPEVKETASDKPVK